MEAALVVLRSKQSNDDVDAPVIRAALGSGRNRAFARSGERR
jgi:hypothetical protein